MIVNAQDIYSLFKQISYEILIPHLGSVSGKNWDKTDGSLCTLYDLLAEEALTEGLKKLYPNIPVIGEESISDNPDLLNMLKRPEGCWVIDPIDGTSAYAAGRTTYGIILAFVQNGEVIRGFIFVPGQHAVQNGQVTTPNEIFIAAEKGKGCFVNNVRVNLNDRAQDVDTSLVSFACRNRDQLWEPVLAKDVTGYRPRFNSAHDYACLLTGQKDAVFYSEGVGKCPPWDHAAGVLAVREAGGFVGVPYLDPGSYDPSVKHDRLLVAASRPLWDSVLTHVRKRATQLCVKG